MRLRLTILSACVVGALFTAGSAAPVTGSAPDADHPYVGLVASGLGLCSGSLVSPTLFVSAAHCFQQGELVRVRFGPRVSPATPFTTGTAHVHPGFAPPATGLPFTNDVAVVVLDAPVAMPVYASLPPAGLADGLARREEVTVVGYGVSVFLGPTPVSDFSRRSADIEVIDRNGAGSESHLRLSPKGADACFGDSGGPVLKQGTHTVLAVSSFSTNPRCQGSYAYRLDTQAARSFLAQFVGG